jgi:hypothetical protein
MATAGIRVKGQKELEAAFMEVRREVLRELRPALREIGELVRAEAQSLFSVRPGWARSAAGYKVRVRQRGVAVEQSLKRTTGLHPNYGSLQMTRALEPALDDKTPEVMARIELLVDASARHAGF